MYSSVFNSGYGIGLFYVTPGGQIMLEMVDYYGGTVTILALASVEVIAINWIYGTSVLTRDFNFMLQVVQSTRCQRNFAELNIFRKIKNTVSTSWDACL